jgi:hypothetical protein
MEKDNVGECLTEEQQEGLAITATNEVIQLLRDLFRQKRYRLIRGLTDKLQREFNIWHEEIGRCLNLAPELRPRCEMQASATIDEPAPATERNS